MYRDVTCTRPVRLWIGRVWPRGERSTRKTKPPRNRVNDAKSRAQHALNKAAAPVGPAPPIDQQQAERAAADRHPLARHWPEEACPSPASPPGSSPCCCSRSLSCSGPAKAASSAHADGAARASLSKPSPIASAALAPLCGGCWRLSPRTRRGCPPPRRCSWRSCRPRALRPCR